MLVHLHADTASPELKRLLREAARPALLYQAGAKAVQKAISSHLKQLQARGNEMGWPTQHFFAGGPNSVERHVGITRADDKGAEITIADPRFLHRITGGTVTPKRAQYLAIPLRASAYALSGKGSLRQSLPGAKVLRTPRGLFLIQVDAASKSSKSKPRGILMFKLVTSVTHKPHPDEQPHSSTLSAAAHSAMHTAAKILLRASQ